MNDLETWECLKIDLNELDTILHNNIFDNLAVEMANLLILRQSKNKLSFLFAEATLSFLGVLFFVPVNLLLGQQWLATSNQQQSFAVAIILAVIFSLVILVSLNLFLWEQAKKLKSIATILQKITQYNCLIQNFQLLNKFNKLSTIVTAKKSQSSSNIVHALQITKDSLLKSLELENFILHNQQLQSQERYRLLNNLEDDLIKFMSLSNLQSNTQYQQLFTEVLNIGLSVHQELRANRTHSLD